MYGVCKIHLGIQLNAFIKTEELMPFGPKNLIYNILNPRKLMYMFC